MIQLNANRVVCPSGWALQIGTTTAADTHTTHTIFILNCEYPCRGLMICVCVCVCVTACFHIEMATTPAFASRPSTAGSPGLAGLSGAPSPTNGGGGAGAGIPRLSISTNTHHSRPPSSASALPSPGAPPSSSVQSSAANSRSTTPHSHNRSTMSSAAGRDHAHGHGHGAITSFEDLVAVFQEDYLRHMRGLIDSQTESQKLQRMVCVPLYAVQLDM
jgi:hypothetical protein